MARGKSGLFKTAAAILVSALSLSACDGGDGEIPTNTPTPSPTPSPSASFSFDVSRCMNQVIPGAMGRTLKQQIIPDTLKLDLNSEAGFPNGRDFDDPVVDLLLAMFFLDLTETGQSIRTFANLPLNPGGNDVPYQEDFPYIGEPQGNPPSVDTSPSTYDFRTDPDSAYDTVDRQGQPAIATVLIGANVQNAYNDDTPAQDATGKWEQEIRNSLQVLNIGIGDDLTDLGLELCAERTTP